MGKIEINGELIRGGFRVVEGYDNLYLVNPFGDIIAPSYVDRSGKFRKTKKLMPHKTHKGYLRVGLMLHGKQVHVYVHRLVARTFINNIKNKPQINHKDGNKLNNTVSNLEYVTAMENVQHSIKNKLSKWANAKGELNNMSKLSMENIKEILSNASSA